MKGPDEIYEEIEKEIEELKARAQRELKPVVKRLQRLLDNFSDQRSYEPWMDKFLEDYERTGNASTAIELSGLSRDTVYKYRRGNEEFDRRWRQLCERKKGKQP